MGQNIAHTSVSIKIAFFTAMATWIGDTILYPIQTISTRLKANKFTNHNPITFAIATIKNDKFKLFRGVSLSLPAIFVPTFVYFTVYDWGMKAVQKIIGKYKYHESTKLFFPFLVSSVAQIAGLFFYLPFDTVRTRVQINHPDYSYKSFVQALKQIKNREGFSRFYKSSRIFFVCKTLQTAIAFQSFQIIRYFAGPSVSWMIFNALFSTIISTTLLNPLQVLITRYALVDTTKKKLIFKNMVTRIYKRQGVKGFYKGYVVELIHHSVYSLFCLPAYQIIREKYGIQLQH